MAYRIGPSEGDDPHPQASHSAAGHGAIPGGGAGHPKACPHESGLVRGALHRLQHLRPGVPGRLHPGADGTGRGRVVSRAAL